MHRQWRLKHLLIITACLAMFMGISRDQTGNPFLLLLVASGLAVIALSSFAIIWRMWTKATERILLSRSSRDLFLAVAGFAVVFAVFTPFVREWDRDEWVHHAITGLLLVPLAVL